jgi:hypothetical protein
MPITKEVFIILLAAHLIGDFVLQPNRMVRAKNNPLILAAHTLIVTSVSGVLLGGVALLPLLILLVSHFLIDLIKVAGGGNGIRAFILDQSSHLLVLLFLSSSLFDLLPASYWLELFPEELWRFYLQALTLIGGFIACLKVGAVVADKTLSRLSPMYDDSEGEGLPAGGKYIGYLERAFSFVLVLAGSLEAVGFVLAAKSIFRFGEFKETGQRAVAEYIIIGTFLSLCWALVISLLTRMALTNL